MFAVICRITVLRISSIWGEFSFGIPPLLKLKMSLCISIVLAEKIAKDQILVRDRLHLTLAFSVPLPIAHFRAYNYALLV